jgi:AcrR family transcriptional regulator
MTEPFGHNVLVIKAKSLKIFRVTIDRPKGRIMNAEVSLKPAPGKVSEDNAKRRQIVEGARATFLAQGFDAASMSDIARAAGVSKGTLYVYFENKEQLFQAIVEGECLAHAEGVFDLKPDDDVETALTRLGRAYVEYLCQPEKASALRTVIAISDRMPEIGKVFYETGPAFGIARVASYLRAQTDAGYLTVVDCEVAAAQFMDACQSTLFKPVLFNFRAAPSPEQIDHVVRIAVQTFLAAYRVRR